MIQVRDVPDRLHRELVRRARESGMTLTEYIQRILEREVSRPPIADVLARIAARTPVDLGASSAEVIRAERTARETR
jgi:hypothetical protein